MNEQARQEYLNKIRDVEKVNKSGGYAVQTGGDFEGGSLAAAPADPSSVSSTTINGNYTIPAIVRYPEKIPLPTQKDYLQIATNYAQKNIANSAVFKALDLTKFDMVASGYPRFIGEGNLRKDFVFYLEELHNLVAPKLKITKLSITSSFRTTKHQNTVVYPGGSITYGAHMAGIAVDIAARGNNRYIIADQAWYMGFGGIAVGADFVHLDIGPYDRHAYAGVPKYISPDKKYGK